MADEKSGSLQVESGASQKKLKIFFRRRSEDQVRPCWLWLNIEIWLERWKRSQGFRYLLHRGEHHPTHHAGLQTAPLGAKQSRAYSASGHLGIWRAEDRRREKQLVEKHLPRSLDQWWSLAWSSGDPPLCNLTQAASPGRRRAGTGITGCVWNASLQWHQCLLCGTEPRAAAGWLASRNRTANSEPANSLLVRE